MTDDGPLVSVIVTTHAWHRYGDFQTAIESIQAQTYEHVELVCPFDDTDLATATRALTDGGIIQYEPIEGGLAAARNQGARLADGDILAFIDDDCQAHPEWIQTLVDAFQDGALAAGGPAKPHWPPCGRPLWFPREFDWLVGVGPHHDHQQEIRNTYGCNIAFRASVYQSLGGFDESLGKNDNLMQGEEAELCQRLHHEYDQGVVYRPDAVVYHRVYPDQLALGHLLRRAYMQGVSKRRIGIDDTETSFLRDVCQGLVRENPLRGLMAVALTGVTGLGYLRGESA